MTMTRWRRRRRQSMTAIRNILRDVFDLRGSPAHHGG